MSLGLKLSSLSRLLGPLVLILEDYLPEASPSAPLLMVAADPTSIPTPLTILRRPLALSCLPVTAVHYFRCF